MDRRNLIKKKFRRKKRQKWFFSIHNSFRQTRQIRRCQCLVPPQNRTSSERTRLKHSLTLRPIRTSSQSTQVQKLAAIPCTSKIEMLPMPVATLRIKAAQAVTRKTQGRGQPSKEVKATWTNHAVRGRFLRENLADRTSHRSQTWPKTPCNTKTASCITRQVSVTLSPSSIEILTKAAGIQIRSNSERPWRESKTCRAILTGKTVQLGPCRTDSRINSAQLIRIICSPYSTSKSLFKDRLRHKVMRICSHQLNPTSD